MMPIAGLMFTCVVLLAACLMALWDILTPEMGPRHSWWHDCNVLSRRHDLTSAVYTADYSPCILLNMAELYEVVGQHQRAELLRLLAEAQEVRRYLSASQSAGASFQQQGVV